METVTIPLVSKFEEFFTSHYKNAIEKLAEQYPKNKALIVDYKLLEAYDIELADELIDKPYAIIQAARDAVSTLGVLTSGEKEFNPYIRFENLPTDSNVFIRDVTSDFLGKLVALDGVITRAVDTKPKLTVGVFECNHCGKIYQMKQDDQTGGLSEPGICACERRTYTLLTGQSTFIDSQKIEIQEPLELLRGGEQSKKISIWLEEDLTNRVVPGDRIQIIGILRLHPPKFKRSVYDIYIDANNLIRLEKEFEEIDLDSKDLQDIKELSNDPKLFDKIIGSIAPSIYGHQEIKEAIALQLFGGTPGKVKADGMKIRPDTHILLIGDPGTGKSQILMYVKNLAPKGLYVSGKSTSAAGLTATAEKDDFGEGGWTLKAGALVLAAGGMAMIDEFDKMDEEDRSAMHEAMEAQEIHVAKAGIIATFKANAAILAGANPKYGRFDITEENLADQFNIPPTIMSRFDLIFPVRDVIDQKKDMEMADHILLSHFTAGVRAAKQNRDISELEMRIRPPIDPNLLRKYIAYARKTVKPVLSEEASNKVKEFYLELRHIGEKQGTVPITPRYLEGLVRLSEASAKARLSNTVELVDADRSVRLMKYCLKEVGIDPETGRFDIDRVMTGQSKSRTDKIRAVLRIVKKLTSQFEEARHEAILEEASGQGIKPDELDDLLTQLKRNGDIYSPKYGIFKPAEER